MKVVNILKILMLSYHTSDLSNSRANTMFKMFKEDRHECKVLYSLYDHYMRSDKEYNNEDWIPIKTIHYKKNLSIRRMLSHIFFAINTMKNIQKNKPDILYIAIPPNSPALIGAMLAKRLGIRVITDIIDMWPEALPVSKRLKKLIFPMLLVWRFLRDQAIKNSDAVIFECD